MMRDLLRWDPFLEMAPIWAPETMTFEVTLTGNRLSLSGKREEESEERGDVYYSRERTYGSFCRSFTLPDGVDTDQVHADLAAGVLTIAVSKRPEAQPKKISVKSAKV